MKLFFDARYIRTDFHDGISRYSASLAHALAAQIPVTFLICNTAQKKFLPTNAQTITIHAPTSVREPLTALALNKHKPDVVFSPMQTMGTLGRKYSVILTLHDLIYYRHRTPPRNLHALIRIGWRAYHLTYVPQRIALNSADRVATVSETSQHDIERTNLTKRPVVVLPNAPQDLRQFVPDGPQHTSSHNLIYMGSFMPYKNVETLVRGMEWLPNHTLHLLSRITPERKRQLQAVAPAGAQIVFHGGVSDEQYAQLLADDAILVSASKDEGYGLPLAEALAFGVPAVVSDLPIFHEVAGEGARYFNNAHPQAFAEQVKAASKPAVRAQLAQAGIQHIQRYSWDKTATALIEAARTLVQ